MSIKSYFVFSLYSLMVLVGDVYIWVFKVFNLKLYELYHGRKNSWGQIEQFRKNHYKPIWIHCASLGEFEQGRPLIEKIRIKYPETPILLSFFSPSGYQVMKHYDKVDAIIYLPSDLPSAAKKIIKYINPRLVIFIKYEFWWNLIYTLINQKIPVILVSGVFRKSNYFFKNIFSPFSNLLKGYTTLFVQDLESANVLSDHKITNVEVVGDTRIDRVIQRSHSSIIPESLIIHIDSKKTIVYGSIWISDLTLINGIISKFPDFTHIIAPHDIQKSNINKIKVRLKIPFDLYSDLTWRYTNMIIDNIGMLSSLYKLASFAYVGGGFGAGIHNILEPCVYKIPVMFGPNYKKFNEAIDLKNKKLSFPVFNEAEAILTLTRLINDNNEYGKIAEGLESYFKLNKGATEKIITQIEKYLD